MTRTFELRGWRRYLQTLVAPIALVLLLLPATTVLLLEEMPGAVRIALFAAAIGSIGLGIAQQLRVPTAIDLEDSGRITFRGPILHLEIDARAIRSIRGDAIWHHELAVAYPGGRIRLPRGFEGFDELLERLQDHNPTIDLSSVH